MKTKMQTKSLFVIMTLLLALHAPSAWATTWYSQGSVAATTLGNWNSNPGGGGSTPANFTTSGDIFVIQNGHSMTVGSAWTLASGVTVEIANGGTLTATALIASLGTFQVDNGGTYYHNAPGSVANGAATDFPGTTRTLGTSSTVEIDQWGQASGTLVALPVPASGWGNLTINITSEAYNGHWSQGGALVLINGNFTIKATGTGTGDFSLASSQTYNLVVKGNFILSGGILYGSTSSSFPSTATWTIGGNYSQTGTGAIQFNSTGGNCLCTFSSAYGNALSTYTFTSSGTPNANGKLNYTIGVGKTLT